MYSVEQNRRNRKAAGLCRECPKPLQPPFVKCTACLFKASTKRKEYHKKNWIAEQERSVKQKRERKENGQCTTCGHRLHQEADADRITCMNCRQNLHSPKNWKYPQEGLTYEIIKSSDAG